MNEDDSLTCNELASSLSRILAFLISLDGFAGGNPARLLGMVLCDMATLCSEIEARDVLHLPVKYTRRFSVFPTSMAAAYRIMSRIE